jgi:hypothetical protein
MGNSTISVQSVIDNVTTQGVPSPLNAPGGYGTALAIDIANDVISELISERFNWKWNAKNAPAFYTNSWQQDYPQIGNADIGWLENADRTDINNTSMPKPLLQITARKALPRTSYARGPIGSVAWAYNRELTFGTWPGANVTYYALVGPNPRFQNPIMSMIDAAGNMLIVTTFGTTGATAPAAPSSSIEGTTVTDGSVVWTVVSPTSKGFRIHPIPGGNGPVYQIIPHYQMAPPTIESLQDFIDPLPDDQARHFRRGYKAYCLGASPSPQDRNKFQDSYNEWIQTLLTIRKDGDKESNVYGLVPASAAVDDIYPGLRNPQDPSTPY